MGSKDIFVVHGRNDKIRKEMFSFLRSIRLHPLEWNEIEAATKNTNPYIGDVLAKGFSMAQAVVVLMTPDDEAQLRPQFRKEIESKDETDLTPKPRPNVLIEAGMAMGMFPDRTILVEFGPLREVSDLLGRNVVRINNSSQQRNKLVQRLRTAKCKVSTTGNDWLTEGNFELDEKTLETKIIIESTTENSLLLNMEKLAKSCNISVDELKNVLSLSGDKIDVVAILNGSTAKKQLIATLCILITHEIILKQEWVSTSTLGAYLQAMGIPDKGCNLSTNLKKYANLFVRRGKRINSEYKLTTGEGRNSAYEVIQKLATGGTI